MNEPNKINYVEFHSKDLEATKAFFNYAFGWGFVDYGPDYAAFTGEGLNGGFFRSDTVKTAETGAPLVIFFSEKLEETLAAVEAAGGAINRAIFDFPGGRRFHFIEPGGNELAVWSDTETDGAVIE